MPTWSSWLNFPKNFLNCLILFLLCFGFFATFAGPVASLRGIDGSLGILKQPMEKGDFLIAKRVRQVFWDPVKADALVFGEVLGAITQGVTKVLTEILKAIVEFVVKIFETIVGTILNLIDDVLKFIDDFIDLLEKLADFINATRVGLAFLVFKDIQNSSNIKNSKDFAKELLGITNKSSGSGSSTAANNPAFLDPAVLEVVTDTISWMDFTNSQRALQADLVSDVFREITGIDLNTYERMENNLINLLVGSQCASTGNLQGGGAFGVLFKAYNPCISERGNGALSNLQSRQGAISNLSNQKVQQFQLRAPADCKARSYIKYDGKSSFSYTPGQLTKNIISVADKIEVINPTPEECELVKEGRREKRDSIKQLMEPSNLALLFGNAAAYLALVQKAFTDLFKEIKESINDRWQNIKDIVKNIRLGNLGLYKVSIEISLSVQNQISNKLRALQKEVGSLSIVGGSGNDETFSGTGDDEISIPPLNNTSNIELEE